MKPSSLNKYINDNIKHPTHLRTYALTHLHTYALTHLRTYALTHLRTYALTHLRTYALTYQHSNHIIDQLKNNNIYLTTTMVNAVVPAILVPLLILMSAVLHFRQVQIGRDIAVSSTLFDNLLVRHSRSAENITNELEHVPNGAERVSNHSHQAVSVSSNDGVEGRHKRSVQNAPEYSKLRQKRTGAERLQNNEVTTSIRLFRVI